MPRYFFHLQDGRDIPDEEGTELSSAEEARSQAVVALGEALKDLDGEFWDAGEWTMTVVDWQRNVVAVLKVTGSRGGPGHQGTLSSNPSLS